MTNDERLSFFMELINCNYQLYHWEYDQEFHLMHTDYTNTLFVPGFFMYSGLEQAVRSYLSEGNSMPALLELEGNLLWIGGFQKMADLTFHTHLVGPILSGRDSLLTVRKRMDSHELSVKSRAAVFKCYESIPAIPTNTLNQYAVMLHYCLNSEKIPAGAVSYLSGFASSSSASAGSVTEQRKQDGHNPDSGKHKGAYHTVPSSHAGVWYAEQQFCQLLSEGSPTYKEALEASHSLSSGMKADFGDAMRYCKSNALVLLTLCSRACISGGLPPSVSYDMNDYYAMRIEECNSMAAVKSVCEEMLDSYVTQVQKAKEQSKISGPIQNSCYYIKTHTTSQLSLKELAKRAGYTEYYFSQKFKKEVGLSVNDFILHAKIEHAKLLLADTGESIQSISDRLAFGSRSYFYTCFQKLTGSSPSEYRRQNGKL